MNVQLAAPEAGDIVWVNFSPQAGKRPALVLSPRSYKEKVGLFVACPITSKAKGYVFEVALPVGLPVGGVVLADHVKSLDWQSRRFSIAGRAPDGALADVRAKLNALLQAD